MSVTQADKWAVDMTDQQVCGWMDNRQKARRQKQPVHEARS